MLSLMSGPGEYSTAFHAGLLKEAAKLVEKMKQIWSDEGLVEAYAFSWPAPQTRSDDGTLVQDLVMMAVPKEGELIALRRFVERTRARGLLLIREEGSTIIALFETQHGARSWIVPIERRGDYWALSTPVVEDNRRSVGILWSPSRGTN